MSRGVAAQEPRPWVSLVRVVVLAPIWIAAGYAAFVAGVASTLDSSESGSELLLAAALLLPVAGSVCLVVGALAHALRHPALAAKGRAAAQYSFWAWAAAATVLIVSFAVG